MAVKKVAKSGGDTSESVTAPTAPDNANWQGEVNPDRPSEPATPSPQSGQSSTQPGQPSTPAPHQDRVVPPPPQDNFIDRDGDGINDNIQCRKRPEIKKDKIEPPQKIEPPSRDSRPKEKTPEIKKDDSPGKKVSKHQR